jgi:hypothetical protein
MGTVDDTMARLGRGNTLAAGKRDRRATEKFSKKRALGKLKHGKRNVCIAKEEEEKTDLVRRGCSWH